MFEIKPYIKFCMFSYFISLLDELPATLSKTPAKRAPKVISSPGGPDYTHIKTVFTYRVHSYGILFYLNASQIGLLQSYSCSNSHMDACRAQGF